MSETEPPTTFHFGVEDDEHHIGNPDCNAGWCDTFAWPKPCDVPGCPGLIHANYIDESWDGYALDTQCDVCGEPE